MPCGSFVDEKLNFLIAKPDGLVGENEIVEIKCPFNAQDMTIQEGIKNGKIKFLSVEKKTKVIKLRYGSHNYTQIQGQLHIAKKTNCYFFVRTKHGNFYEVHKCELTLKVIIIIVILYYF